MAIDFTPKSNNQGIKFTPKVAPIVAPTPVPTPKLGTLEGFTSPFKQAGIGIGKSLGNTIAGLGVLGRNIEKAVLPKALEGKSGIFDKGSKANLKMNEALAPKTTGQKTSKLVTDIGQYLLPGAGVNKATSGLSFIPRVLARTAPDIAVSALQSQGDVGVTTTTGASSLVSNLLIPGSKAKIASTILGGALPGYVSDIGTGLTGARGEERTGGKAFIPGLGTAIGTGLGVLSAAPQIKENLPFTEKRTINKRSEALTGLKETYAKVDKAVKAAERKGVDANKVLSETNLLNGAVDTDGKVNIEKALANFNEFINPYEGKVKEALQEEGRTVSLNNIVDDAKAFIEKSSLSDIQKSELQKEIARNLDSFNQFNGSNVPLTSVHDTKVFLAGNNNYLNPAKDAVDKEAARFFKELVENNSTIMDVGGYNAELSKFYSIKDVINSLDRTRVKGGRAGKYFSSLVGGVAGASAGGPLGAIVGAEAGSKVQGTLMSKVFGGNINKGLQATEALRTTQKPLATGKAAIPELIIPKKKVDVPELNLQSSKSKISEKKLGALKIIQPTTITPVKNAIFVKPTPKTEISKVTGTPTTITEKLKLANEIQPKFENQVANIAKSVGLDFSIGPVKTIDRIKEKIATDYKGDINKLRDINRSVVFAKSFDDIDSTILAIEKSAKKEFGDITRITKTLGTPSYNKVIVNVPTKAGEAEIQITTKDMWDAKMNGGDVIYGLERSPKTKVEVKKILTKRLEELYQSFTDSSINQAANAINKGGVSMDIGRNIDYGGTPNISVAPFPEKTKLITGKVTPLDIAKYYRENFDLLQKESYALGGWYDSESKQTYLDVALLVNKKNANLAEKLAKATNQKAVFDLETFEEVNTGGTGEVTGSMDSKVVMKMIQDILDKNKE